MAYDLIVIGAGITGASIAYEMSRKGYKPLVVDKLRAAGHGSTSSSSAIIRTHYSTLTATAVAYESWFCWNDWANHLGAAASSPLARFIPTGAVLFSHGGFDWSTYISHHDRLKIPYEVWNLEQLFERLPHFVDDSFHPPKRPEDPEFDRPSGKKLHDTVLYFPNNGYINDPQLAVENLKAASESHGATYLFGAEVVGIRKRGGRVEGVSLRNGDFHDAPVVVNAAGPHSFLINRMVGIDQCMKLGTRALRHEVHCLPSPPTYSYEHNKIIVGDGDLAVHHRPEVGDLILVGSEDPPCDELEWIDDPDTFNRNATEERWQAQVYRLALRMPSLPIPNNPRGYADLYDVSDDWNPIYDRSDLDGLYLAIGTSGNQFKNGPMIGRIMAQIIDSCENGHDHDGDPVSVYLEHIDRRISTGSFSRNREIIRESSFSVLG